MEYPPLNKRGEVAFIFYLLLIKGYVIFAKDFWAKIKGPPISEPNSYQ